jgi:type I restriction enzyme M protein
MLISQSQLEQYLSKAAWILKGPVDASDFKSYIFPLLFFKRISDVYDEEYEIALKESGNDKDYASLKEFHRFIIPKDCHWKDVRETSVNVGVKIQSAIREIESANQEYLSGIFGDVQWSNKEKLSDELLNNLIDHFSQYNLSNSSISVDILGDAYEYLIKHFADLTNKKAGEFYTPRSVVNLMVKILDPKEHESIYDPACGTGGMLIECLDYLKKNNLNSKTLKIYGQESNLTTSSIARINLFLHNAEDFDIYKGDTLRNPGFFEKDNLKKFDCVLANPPFSLKNWGRETWSNDPFGRNITGVPPEKNGDMAWIQHMIKSMNNHGRMAVVLPSGVLFRKGVERQIRKSLIDQDLLETVINLGPNIFYGTPLAPSILIFRRKKTKEKKHKVFLIDATDQIKQDRAKNYLEKIHVKTIFERYTSYKQIKNISKIISTKELKENNFSFDITLYLKKSIQKNLPLYKDMKVKINDAWNNSLKSKKIFLNIMKKNLQ